MAKRESKRDYFPAFFKYREILAPLEDADVGKLFRAALAYAEDGTAPSIDASLLPTFIGIRYDIDSAAKSYEEKCEANRANANKRWDSERMRTDATASERMRMDANDANTIQGNTIQDNIRERDARAHTREGNEIQTGGEGGNGFAAPDAEAVRQYCEEAGIAVNADRFVEHYGSLGWMKGGQPIRDWKALARKWAREDKEKAAAEQAAAEESTGYSSFDTDDFAAAAFARTYGKGGGQ